MTTKIMIELLYQVGILILINSVTVQGVKVSIRRLINMPDDQKLNRFVILPIIIAFGIVSGFLIKSEFVDALWKVIIFGVFISAWTIVIYKSLVRTLLNIIPKLENKLLG